jgi:hypothetical protein
LGNVMKREQLDKSSVVKEVRFQSLLGNVVKREQLDKSSMIDQSSEVSQVSWVML